jgi:hypothetical protein
MIFFIIFKFIVNMYGFEVRTVDNLSGIFAFFSVIEFVLVVIFAVIYSRPIFEFLRSLKK